MTTVWINVKIVEGVEEEDLDHDDQGAGIPGWYEVILGDEAASLPRDQQGAAALDVFHEDIAIACLDDFEIEVCEEDGSYIENVGEHPSYSWNGGGTVSKLSEEPKV
jgi:hypothetical protein